MSSRVSSQDEPPSGAQSPDQQRGNRCDDEERGHRFGPAPITADAQILVTEHGDERDVLARDKASILDHDSFRYRFDPVLPRQPLLQRIPTASSLGSNIDAQPGTGRWTRRSSATTAMFPDWRMALASPLLAGKVSLHPQSSGPSTARKRIVPVPEYEYVEVVKEFPEIRVEEKIVPVEVVNVVEETIYVPKIVEVEKIVEIPQIEYKEVLVERVVEIPEVREQVIVKEVPKDQFVEVDVPEFVEIEDVVEVTRKVPRAMESIQHVDFFLPRVKVTYEEIPVPCYTPVFIEIPVPVEQLDEESRDELYQLREDIELATGTSFPSLGVLEDIASRSSKFRPHMETDPARLLEHWRRMARQGVKRTTPVPSDPGVPEGNEDAFSDDVQPKGSIAGSSTVATYGPFGDSSGGPSSGFGLDSAITAHPAGFRSSDIGSVTTPIMLSGAYRSSPIASTSLPSSSVAHTIMRPAGSANFGAATPPFMVSPLITASAPEPLSTILRPSGFVADTAARIPQ